MDAQEAKKRLTDIQERCDKATVGPWRIKTECLGKYKGQREIYFQIRPTAADGIHRELLQTIVREEGCGWSDEDKANAEFAMNARVDVPWLLARCAELAAHSAQVEAELAGAKQHMFAYQKEILSAEAELVKLREALREAINFIEETADGMCVIGQETNCSRAAKPIYEKLSAFYEALGETGPEEK